MPEALTKGMVSMMESVTAPFGPDSVVTRALLTRSLPKRTEEEPTATVEATSPPKAARRRTLRLRCSHSRAITQTRRIPTSSAVTRTTRPHAVSAPMPVVARQ